MATTLTRPDVDGFDAISEDVESLAIQPKKAHDFSEQIGQYERIMEDQKTRRNLASNPQELMRLRDNVIQLTHAIDLWKQAEFIPAEWTQFGSAASKEWNFNLPPKIVGLWTPDMKVQARNYVYRTNDPFHIAACRDVADKRRIEGMFEMEPGMAPAINPDGALFDWLKGDQLLRWNTSGSARSY